MRGFLLAVTFSLSVFSTAYADNVARFSFVTKPQTILPNTLSKEITIQSQNSSGLVEPMSETVDLTFTSSSPTGLFLGSTGKPVSKTMSKNTANRTFYYKDSSIGNFVISVVATGRDSKRYFNLEQGITISNQISTTTKPVTILSVQSAKPAVPKTKVPQTKIEVRNLQNQNLPATSTIIFTAPVNQGFFGSLLSWPKRIFQFILHLFVEE